MEFERWWPAKFLTEAHDQTRGWFYSQLGSSCIAFDRAPYDSVLVHGWMLDSQGQPMSKSKGNVVEPSKVMAEFGADALRFYLLRVSAPWEDISFQNEGVKNARKMLNILWNVASFATMYMSLDNYDHLAVDEAAVKAALRPEDRWLTSRTEKLKTEVTRNIETCDLHKACRALEDYVLEDLSRWYVRLIRDRMWREATDLDKLAAYHTLYEGLMTAVKLLAPFCPHITEEIYQAMDGRLITLHMSDWPEADGSLIDEDVEASMALMQELVEEIAKERQKKNVKLRWPLQRILVRGSDPATLDLIRPMEEVLLSQSDVKEIEYLPAGEEPSLPENVVAVPFDGGDLYIDFNMTPELQAEGYAREITRRIQQMRKDMKLDVEEFVRVEMHAPADITENLKPWQDHIMKEVRAVGLDFTESPQGKHLVEWEVDGLKIDIALTPSGTKN